MSNESKLSEPVFFEIARSYLRDVIGKDCSRLTEDTDLIKNEYLDSVLLISFFCFLEEQRGAELSEIPDLRKSFTLRSAYALVISNDKQDTRTAHA